MRAFKKKRESFHIEQKEAGGQRRKKQSRADGSGYSAQGTDKFQCTVVQI